jgi:hypothetical protein
VLAATSVRAMTDLRSHVSFDAPQFASEATEEGGPGEDLAKAVAAGLQRRGFKCTPPEDYEGFAWQLDVELDGKTWLISAGHFGDPDIGQWLVFAETVAAGGGGLFRKRPPRWTVEALAAALHSVVTEDLGTTPHWYTADEWQVGPVGAGSPTP